MELVQRLNSNGFGATTIEAHGAKEKIFLVYSIVQRNELPKVMNVIHNFNPRAFFTIEDIRAVNEGIFTHRKHKPLTPFGKILRSWRKGK